MIGGWSLLIVDRTANDAEQIVQILGNHGLNFEWRLACSAASLQQVLREWTCDLVLCDVNVPGFDVESLGESLEASARLDVPLIVISDSIGEETVADLMRRGAADFVLRANLETRLANAVQRELENATARRQDRSAGQFNQRLFETSLDLILVTDRRGTFVRVNPISLELLGYRPDEMVGHSADEFIYPADLDNTREEMRAGRRGRVTRHFECRYIRKDGTIAALDWTGVWAEPEQQHIFIGRDLTALKATESALRSSEARLALAVEIAQIGVTSAGTAAAPTGTDAAFNRIYGRPDETSTMSAGEWLRLLHPEDRDQAAADLLTAVRQGGLFRGDFRIRRADTGEERWVRTVTRVAVDADGRPGQFLGVHTDITDMKSAIDALIDREALLALAMQIVGLGMATSETYADLAQTDQQFRNIYGLRPDQTTIGVGDWFRLLHPEDRNRIAVTLLRAIKGGEPYAGEFRFHRADTGEERWARALLRTVTDAAGRYGRSLSVHLDITEQKKAIEALHKSADQLNEAQQLANMGSTRVNLQSGEIEWSDQTYRIFGVSREAYQPTMTNLFAFVHPEDRDQFVQSREAVRQGRSPGPSEYRIKRPDGTVRYIHRQNQVVRDARGEPRYLTGTLQDVTERRQIEEQLRQSQKMEALGNLTGGIAHDFNNMLGVIIGGLDFSLPMVGDNDEAKELLQVALDAALSAADLTKGLLAFARQQPLRPERININRLVTSLVRLLRRILGEDVHIALDLADDLCPVVVDAAQLESSLTNLAANARDAMPTGGRLSITTANRRLDTDYAESHTEVTAGDYAVIEVTDTGTGMPPAVLERVFDPFFTTKNPGKGTGLGLSMVFGFIKQSNGHISAYSEPGIGTTFRLYLPSAVEAVAVVEKDTAPVTRGAGQRVLVVEDNPALRRVALRQIRELGYDALEADGPQAAIAVLERESVDLLFTDVVMPGLIDGVGLAQLVFERWPDIRVLLTSGFPGARVDDRLNALGSRAQLLSKPYRMAELAGRLRDVLDS